MKPGGTEGGTAEFVGGIGLILVGLALYFLFDSVHVGTHGNGVLSGLLLSGSAGTASMGIIFVPFVAGVALLFYNSKNPLGSWLLWSGLGIIVIEILSRIRFSFDMKTSHLLIILGMFGAGVGLLLKSFRTESDNGKP